MMKLSSLLHKDASYSSLMWYDSSTVPGVRFALRQMSLQQRIELNGKLREIALKYEFLRCGDAASQLEAGLVDLLVSRLYLEWGVAQIVGLSIDGKPASVESLIALGPEALTGEIAGAIQRDLILTDEERKNS